MGGIDHDVSNGTAISAKTDQANQAIHGSGIRSGMDATQECALA
jgi:hypothetical protein